MDFDYNNKILDDLYETRGEELEEFYIAKYGKPKEEQQANLIEEDLINFMKKFIKDKKDIQKLCKKINQYESLVMEQMDFWYKIYYKQGFIDGINLIKEVQKEKNLSSGKNEEIKKDSFFYNYIDSVLEFIEYNRFNIWQKRKNYQEIINKMNNIKNKYPKIRLFIDDETITELNKEELQVLLEYINLDNCIEKLEKLEIFKLGIKEGNLL